MKSQKIHYMRYIVILMLVFSSCISTWVQSEEENGLKVFLQTDLLAYTTPGGWSAWASAQSDRYKLYVSYPNRLRERYEETGIRENFRWLRIQLSNNSSLTLACEASSMAKLLTHMMSLNPFVMTLNDLT